MNQNETFKNIFGAMKEVPGTARSLRSLCEPLKHILYQLTLIQSSHPETLARPPRGQDFNDMLTSQALRNREGRQ